MRRSAHAQAWLVAVGGDARGTMRHGIFEDGAFRGAFPRPGRPTGKDFTPAAGVRFAAIREHRYGVLAGMIERHLDTEGLPGLISDGATAARTAVVRSSRNRHAKRRHHLAPTTRS